MIEQVLITTTADTSQAETQYVGLRQEISLLKKQLDTLEEGTKEYDATFSKLSAKMFEQRERMQALKNSAGDLGQMLGNVSGLAGTISQGFAGATAALSLFGIENENLLRTIQKVQAFESIARTLTELEDAPKKIKALFNNIKGVFGGSNKLTIDVQAQAKVQEQVASKVTQQTIDSVAFEKSADAADRISKSATITTGATTAAAAQQAGITTELAAQSNEKVVQSRLDQKLFEQTALNINKNRESLAIKIKELETEIQLIEARKANATAFTNEEQESLDALNKRKEFLQTTDAGLAKSQEDIKGKIADTTKDIKKSSEATKTFGSSIKSFFSNIGGVLAGIGIGALIAGIIFAVSKITEYFKKLGEATKLYYTNAMAYNKEYAEAITQSTEKELSTLKVLDAGYKNLNKNKQAQNKYLKDNAKFYKEIGIDVNKIISGEIDYNKQIQKTTKSLVERGKAMGVVNLLISKYSKQAELQTEVFLNSQSIASRAGINFAFVRNSIGDITSQVTQLISMGYGNTDSILNKIRENNKEAFDSLTKDQLQQLRSGIYDLLAKVPDDTQEKMKEVGTELNNVNKAISILEPQVTGLFETTTKGGDKSSTTVKTYNQLLSELLKAYENVNLNNPFTPEEIRKNELFFLTTKEGVESLILQLVKLGGGYESTITALEDYQIRILEAERLYNTKVRNIKLDEAAWERDNLIRSSEENLSIKKKEYEQILKDAKESFKAGAITEKEFKDIQDRVSKATDTSIIEFTKLLNKQLSSGEINFQQFRDKLNEFAGTDLTVLDPTNINYGKLTIDNYNYLQDLLSNWEDYYQKVQEANTTFKDSDKVTTEEIFAVRMSAIDKLSAEVSRKTAEANAKITMDMNARNTKLWTVGFAGIRSGYLDVLDEITQLQNEASLASSNQTFLQQRIDLMNEELTSETITAEKRIELLDSIKQAEADLTAAKQTETERRLSIAQKEQEVRDEIFSGIKEAITDIDSVISAGYNIAEQSELARLKKLYNAKLITQEEYTTQSEAISDKYTKKRLELEIFTGTMSAIGTSIAAFQSAVESKIPYPYNLILAGISSAAAFGSVMASVSQLQSLSIGDTSVSPTASSTGSGLTYSLNQQSATNERLLNSITDQRVYVLESDITGTQATIKEIEDMSTF